MISCVETREFDAQVQIPSHGPWWRSALWRLRWGRDPTDEVYWIPVMESCAAASESYCLPIGVPPYGWLLSGRQCYFVLDEFSNQVNLEYENCTYLPELIMA